MFFTIFFFVVCEKGSTFALGFHVNPGSMVFPSFSQPGSV